MLEHIEFSHFGLAVDNFSKTKEFLFKFNYTEFKSEFDKAQNVQASLMVHEKFPSIEILSKLNKDDVTPIDDIIKNNNSHLRICENNYRFSGHVSILKNVSHNNPEHAFLSFSQENVLFHGENFMGGL